MSNEPRGPRRRAVPQVDFLQPSGAPALYAPDSLAWQVFKNPISLFIGGITAVLLELAEERVRTGVWEHSIFPTDPLTRMQRTGLMTHVSVYAPVEVAEKLIRGVVAMHARVQGTTPKGTPYRANDPELLNWVQCTVSFGFMEAYAAFCRPLSEAQRDHFYRESMVSARLFLAHGAPQSLAEQRQQFERMRPHLEAHPIILQFLEIVQRTSALPLFLRPLQSTMVRAGISLLPDWLTERLGLQGKQWRLKSWEQRMLKTLGALFERVPLPNTAPTLASRRMGLPASYLYKRFTATAGEQPMASAQP
ncbi:oxygenase MpaB family protein [Steroidobacter flavus]|uniref:Oxygenase MpaB family protein n=1 Tax=Steroidobacter flavus TaxID=1842136 RepID=A0ABV8SZU1_9GAMM